MQIKTVYNFLNEFNNKAVDIIESTKTERLNGTVMHVDETSSRCEKKNMFFRNYSNENYFLYTANPTKGKAAIVEDGILPNYIGTLVHDHNTVNYNYGSENAECNVHLIRYLRANFEYTHHDWSDDMILLLLSMNRTKKLAISYGLDRFDQGDIDEYLRRYDQIVSTGFENMKNTKSTFFKKEEKKFLNRLKKYQDNHLRFVLDFDVPFDNNLSERDLRMIKTKVSGCFRSLHGAKIFANLMSVTKTAIKQNVSPFVAVKAVFCGGCR